MNYYEHHIGDYAAATGHLSLVEDAVYTRMLRRYYLTETPLPADMGQVARLVGARQQEEIAAVEAVLGEFFTLQADGWHQKRADEDIAKYLEKQGKARASADARWADKRPQCERNANAMRTQCERNAHQTPDTKHQTKEKKGRVAAPELPDWLPADVWQDWHDYRNSRKGWTAKARALSLASLTALWRDGQDPRAVVNQAIERGWTGLFPLRTDHARAGPAATQSKTLTAIKTLEDMKHGLAGYGTPDGLSETALLGTGSDSRD